MEKKRLNIKDVVLYTIYRIFMHVDFMKKSPEWHRSLFQRTKI